MKLFFLIQIVLLVIGAISSLILFPRALILDARDLAAIKKKKLARKEKQQKARKQSAATGSETDKLIDVTDMPLKDVSDTPLLTYDRCSETFWVQRDGGEWEQVTEEKFHEVELEFGCGAPRPGRKRSTDGFHYTEQGVWGRVLWFKATEKHFKDEPVFRIALKNAGLLAAA